jgi:hypothetical protein
MTSLQVRISLTVPAAGFQEYGEIISICLATKSITPVRAGQQRRDSLNDLAFYGSFLECGVSSR